MILERIKSFLIVSILSECPEAPYVGISLKEVIRQQGLMVAGEDRTRLQASLGISNETVEKLNKRQDGLPHPKKIATSDSSIRKGTFKELDLTVPPSRQMWLNKVAGINGISLEIARGWDLSRVQEAVKSLREADEKRGIDKEANLAEINMNTDIALMVRFVECADRKTFDFIDPAISMTEGELLRALSVCESYMSRFPQSKNIGVLFNAIRKMVEKLP